MLTTEEEAKAKWCPHRRDVTAMGGGFNGAAASNAGATCVGSKCMMWRFDEAKLGKLPSGRGYCGLAGKP